MDIKEAMLFGSIIDLFMSELRVQASEFGELRVSINSSWDDEYYIGTGNPYTSSFTKTNIEEYILNKISTLKNETDVGELVSQFINELIDKEYAWLGRDEELKIYKIICTSSHSIPGTLEKKILSKNYFVRFYYSRQKSTERLPVTMKMLKKMNMSEDEFLTTFEAEWEKGEPRIKYDIFDDFVSLRCPSYGDITECIVNQRVLNRISEMLDNNPFFIVSESNGRTFAIKKEAILRYLEVQQRGKRSSFDYIQSVLWSTFPGQDRFLARKILYYNPKTKILSDVCNEDMG